MIHKRKLEDYIGWQSSLCMKREKAEWPGIKYRGEDAITQSVCDWLSRNVNCDREFKSRQLWLSGPPDSRKTSLCRKLEAYFHTYWTPNSELFYDGYDDTYELIIMDEFREGKPSEWLNLWLEGSTMMIRRKGQAPVCKRRNQPVIICSNYRPHQIYGEPMAIACLNARIDEIQIVRPLDLDNLKFEAPTPPMHLEIIESSDDEVDLALYFEEEYNPIQ